MAELSRVRGFTFNGTTVDNMLNNDIYLLDVDKAAAPEQHYAVFDLPNRDGDLIVPDKYSNKFITVTVGIWALKAADRRAKEREILKNIVGKKGRLIFLDEPSLFYEASVHDEIKRKEDKVWTKITISFICSPFMYELYGDLRDETISSSQRYADDDGALINISSWENITSSFTDRIINAGNYKAMPEIYLFGNAKTVTVRINNDEFSFSDLNGFVYINCKNLVVYTISDNKKKSLLTNFSGAFPVIEAGENSIEIGGNNLKLDEIQINFPNTYIV